MNVGLLNGAKIRIKSEIRKNEVKVLAEMRLMRLKKAI